MTKEEKKEYAKRYYQENKERLRKQNIENYYKRTARTKRKKKEKKTPTFHYSHKYKGFHFSYADEEQEILFFQASMPFRAQYQLYSNNRNDDKVYGKLQSELRKRINEVDKSKKLVILEPSYLQVYLTDITNLDGIVNVCREFITEQTNIYGQYTTTFLGEKVKKM